MAQFVIAPRPGLDSAAVKREVRDMRTVYEVGMPVVASTPEDAMRQFLAAFRLELREASGSALAGTLIPGPPA